MRILGIIPARGGSKGIAKKNIKKINGLPLIVYTIKQAQQSKFLENTIISTDDPEIAKCAQKFGGNIPFLRPIELATDTTKSEELVIHAIKHFKKLGVEYQAVCLLQPTSPYRPSGVIDAAIAKFIKNPKNSLISVRRVPDHYNPYWTFKKTNGGLQPTIDKNIVTRRQDLPETFHRDGAIYICRTETLMKSKSFYTKYLTSYEITSPELINIDKPEDWIVATKYINLSIV